MADAIAKVSWRTTVSGHATTAPAQGGIIGTCFTLETGVTISCAHNMDTLFKPNPGYDAFRVYVLEWGGRVTELHYGCLRLFPDYDACVIEGYQSSRRYKISHRDPSQITSCNLRGYQSHATPFRLRLADLGRAIEIHKPNIRTAAQTFQSCVPQLHTFSLDSPDVKVANKMGYLFDARAVIGLSGGPMLDATDGSAAGLCFAGWPPDIHQKTKIGVIDIRQFPFIQPRATAEASAAAPMRIASSDRESVTSAA